MRESGGKLNDLAPVRCVGDLEKGAHQHEAVNDVRVLSVPYVHGCYLLCTPLGLARLGLVSNIDQRSAHTGRKLFPITALPVAVSGDRECCAPA
jgi:hypothetical protein